MRAVEVELYSRAEHGLWAEVRELFKQSGAAAPAVKVPAEFRDEPPGSDAARPDAKELAEFSKGVTGIQRGVGLSAALAARLTRQVKGDRLALDTAYSELAEEVSSEDRKLERFLERLKLKYSDKDGLWEKFDSKLLRSVKAELDYKEGVSLLPKLRALASDCGLQPRHPMEFAISMKLRAPVPRPEDGSEAYDPVTGLWVRHALKDKSWTPLDPQPK
ncbi:MAG: hypothetical protein HYZ75_18605 [Elusimicrobia bacterium]|nr:hypothetical protein [Elusimicrobiota bacterium]